MEDFLDAFAAFFSFAVKRGFFLVVFLLSWPLLMVVSFLHNLKNLRLIRANFLNRRCGLIGQKKLKVLRNKFSMALTTVNR